MPESPKLPQKAASQIWAYYSDGTVSLYRLLSISTLMTGSPGTWNSVCVKNGPGSVGQNVVLFRSNLHNYYYVGDNDEVIKDGYKPEPAVGQFWLNVTKGPLRIIGTGRPRGSIPVYKCKEYSYPKGYFEQPEVTFVGWYDTSGVVAKNGIDLKRYPHKCPTCKEAAYIGFNQIDCSAGCRK